VLACWRWRLQLAAAFSEKTIYLGLGQLVSMLAGIVAMSVWVSDACDVGLAWYGSHSACLHVMASHGACLQPPCRRASGSHPLVTSLFVSRLHPVTSLSFRGLHPATSPISFFFLFSVFCFLFSFFWGVHCTLLNRSDHSLGGGVYKHVAFANSIGGDVIEVT
jgi:hypothetical protein